VTSRRFLALGGFFISISISIRYEALKNCPITLPAKRCIITNINPHCRAAAQPRQTLIVQGNELLGGVAQNRPVTVVQTRANPGLPDLGALARGLQVCFSRPLRCMAS
jgi:hypothetical protein